MEGASLEGVTNNGRAALKVSCSITDGGELDEDGVANGTIIDPVGVAVADKAIVAPSEPESDSSSKDINDSTAPNITAPNTGFEKHYVVQDFIMILAGIFVLSVIMHPSVRRAIYERILAKK